MSSKRGRKRNDNLPPNRARDVQRAFRARRAAHLQALEQRVSELEEENDCLRQAMNLPPSVRPPLGKGPTGKDKAKIYDAGVGGTQSLGFQSSRESSSPESPGSRGSSHSPSAITVSMSGSSRPMTVIEPNSWSDSMLLNDHQQQQHQQQQQQQQHTEVAGPSEPAYHIPPLTAPMPLKALQYPVYNNNNTNSAFPPASRPLSSNLYTGSPNNYAHSSDRLVANSYGTTQHFSVRGELREDSRQQYSYGQSFSSHDPNGIHSQTPPPPSITSHGHSHQNSQRDSPLPYPHRRSLTDPQGFSIGQGFPHLPNPAQLQQTSRTPDYMRQQQQQESMHLTAPSRSGPYPPDGRLNSIP